MHGDLNTASVLFQDRIVTGVVDWEFAGTGWREYDLAWVLRARKAFLNTLEERQAILAGYGEHTLYDADALRWCEVLNYLHFAYWCKDETPADASFFIEKAQAIAGLAHDVGQQPRRADAADPATHAERSNPKGRKH